MWGPNTLGAFTIRVPNARNVVKGVDLVAGHPVHRLMELWNGGDEFDRSCGLDLLWPVLLHPLEEIDTAIVARFLYEIPVTAHKLDICTPATAHHPNFSHMLVLVLGSLGVHILY